MADDVHEPFDSVTLTGPDGEEHDITRLFEESPEERELRRSFYDTSPERTAGEEIDAFVHGIKLSGSLALKEKLDNLSRVSVTFADADGKVIASGLAEISVGFRKTKTKTATFMERSHTAKLIEEH
jgi:hypothetical protein